MKAITVFTPTYNRAHLLPCLYNSLCQQSTNLFEWLIIDDGSTDETKKIVNIWISQKKIQIKYFYQHNQGMIAAHNTAHYNMQTDLCVCIDSDDFMPKNGIEKILKLWN